MPDEYDYISKYYRVPARRGGRVRVNGREGVIIGATHYLVVDFGEADPGMCHPTWRVEYLEDAETRDDAN